MTLQTSHDAKIDAQMARKGAFRYPMKGTSRASRRARQERVPRQQEGPRARKNVTHIVTILCVQGAPRYLLSLPRQAHNFSFFSFLFPFL